MTTDDNESVFNCKDNDGDRLEVTEHHGNLIFNNYNPGTGDSVGVRLEPARVNDLHSALGAWMAENGITARAAVTLPPETDGVTFSGLVARVTEMERRQACSHQSLTASLEQDADKIGNLTHAVNRLHRRVDALATHEGRLKRLEESDVSTVPDDEEATDLVPALGGVIKGLAYLRGAVDSMHEDLFRQASGLATSAQLSRNGTHEALVGLLTEIRDRLPAPVLRCLDTAPDGSSLCELEQGHTGRHQRGVSSWPQLCGEPSPYDVDEKCVLPPGHSVDHHNGKLRGSGRKAWQPT